MLPNQILDSEKKTKKIAKLFAQNLKSNDIVLFCGDLGSGKTFFCREIIKYFCGENTKIISPTFNILQTYLSPKFTIYHFDLYRLKSPEKIYNLGIEEAFNGNLCLIEWPEIIEHILPKPLIKIYLQTIDDHKRYFKMYDD